MTWRTLLALVPAALLFLGAIACVPQRPSAPQPPIHSEALELAVDGFVGNAACAPCHKVNFESHTHSRHMQTLREGTQTALGAQTPQTGPLPEGGQFTLKDGQCFADAPVRLERSEQVPLQLVLGSGKTGLTFLSLFTETGAELRFSYFPSGKQWLPTPGRKHEDEASNGRLYTREELRECLACHSVTLPLTGIQPERRFFGVGCESCHGPGAEHVVSMEKKDKSQGLKIRVLRGLGGTELNAVCGKCHRTADDVANLDAAGKKMTQRFQPYGLSLSACFKKSGDKLSCATCHDPHKDASRDAKSYEKVCLSCHSPASNPSQKACPVNPKEKCVACHMPTVRIFPPGKSPIATAMADHYIRIFPKKP